MLKTIALAALGLLFVTQAEARGRGGGYGSHVHVNGYFTSRGTYVQPHYRTAPNATMLDNWSTRGNVNPYTGQAGTKVPHAAGAYAYGHPYREPAYQPDRPTYAPPLPEGYGFRQRYEANLASCLRNGASCDMDLIYNEDIAKVRASRARIESAASIARRTETTSWRRGDSPGLTYLGGTARW